jgi:hypothetical protein
MREAITTQNENCLLTALPGGDYQSLIGASGQNGTAIASIFAVAQSQGSEEFACACSGAVKADFDRLPG